jgi:F-type H+-transporting ATPase subunit b
VQIDLFTLVAQIVNFLILVGVLWYFLFNRITKVIDKREDSISSRFEEAEQKKDEAEQEKEEYIQKKTELENNRDEIISQARSEAEDKRRELIQEARDEVDESKKEWRQSLEEQKASFLKQLRQRAGKQVYAVTRRVLKDMANEDIEKHIIEMFAKKIRELDGDEKEEITELVRGSEDNITVISAFELNQDMRKEIRDVLISQFADDVDVDFEKSPDLISGVELRTNGRKVSWSLASYLDSLETQLSEAFERETKGARERNAEGERETTDNTG